VEPAVELAASGIPGAVVLECLAERTIVAGLRDPGHGYDRRLERRLTPLLPAADGCRIVTNMGAADPEGAARATRRLARRLGLEPRIAAVVGDDVSGVWAPDVDGEWLGAHAYLGADALEEAVEEGADVIITGRVADAALFSAPLRAAADPLALTVGHLLECAAQVTGGNFEPPGGGGLSAAEFARIGHPLATLREDGAELFVLEGARRGSTR
jgi:hypothetical protein